MVQALLAVSAVVPSILLVWYFHARDVYPEPARVIWTTFGLGLLTTLPVLAVGVPLHLAVGAIRHPVSASLCEAVFVAAIPEEFFKLTVLVWYSMRQEAFDEPMDGIVYGAVASLGFATFENLVYVLDGGTGVALSRAFSAVPLHAFVGAIMGYYVGQAWKKPARRFRYIGVGYGLAVLLHSLYDFPLMTMKALDNNGPNVTLTLATGAVLVLVWRWALRLTAGLRREQLALQGVSAADVVGRVAPVRGRRHRGLPVAQITLGVLSASLGGMVVLGLLLAFLLRVVAAEDIPDLLLGGSMIGVVPLALGALLFRFGVRGLNRRGSQVTL